MIRCMLLLCVMLSMSTAFAQQYAPTLQEKGTTLVPLRIIAEWMGADVQFNVKTRTITFTLDGRTVALTINSRKAVVDGLTTTLAVPPKVSEGTTFVPLRFVSTSLGLQVIYRTESHEIVLRQQTPPRQMVLLYNMADARTVEEGMLIADALKDDNAEAIEKLCTERPWLLDIQTIGSMSLPGLAASANATETLKLLLGKGVDVNAKNREGFTLLHIAVITGAKVPVLEMLTEAGADLAAAEPEIGAAPLHIAASMGNKEAAEFLLDHKADINVPLAKSLEKTPLADLPRDKAGYGTALMLAVYADQTELVDLLLNRGATPLDPELQEMTVKLREKNRENTKE